MSDRSQTLLACPRERKSTSNSHFTAPAMARRPVTTPRKHATQDRSRMTVDALVEATARHLGKEGFDTMSTNKVAQAAGVSSGSLYQHYPSKDARVAAGVDRHHEQTMSGRAAPTISIVCS